MMNWWLLLFPLASAALLWPCLIGTQALAGADYAAYWYPLFGFAGESFRKTGELPFWLPHILGGMPLGDSLGPSLYYPTDVLGWLLGIPPGRRIAADVWLHLTIAGTGAWRLATAMRVRPSAAVAAGLIFMLGGMPTDLVRTGTLVFVRGAAWTPWILLAVHGGLTGRGRDRWLAAGVLLALLHISAAHQIVAYLVIILPIFALTISPGRPARSALYLACAFTLAGLLGTITILPSIRYYGLSLRSNPGIDLGVMGRTEFFDLPLLLVPSLWGPGIGDTGKYLGVVAAGLAALGIAARFRDGWRWALLGGLAILFALGEATPAGSLLARLPLYGGLRVPAHWLMLAQLTCAIAAGLGLTVLLERGRHGWRVFAAIWVAGAAVLGSAWWCRDELWRRANADDRLVARIKAAMGTPRRARAEMESRLRWSAGACGGAALASLAASAVPVPALAVAVGALAAGELLVRDFDRRFAAPPDTVPGLAPAGALFPSVLRRDAEPFRVFTEEFHTVPNMRMSSGLEWVQGYHGAPLSVFARFHDAVAWRCPASPALFTWLNVRYYILRDPAAAPNLLPMMPVANEAGQRFVLCEDPEYLPRAFFVARVDAAESDDAVLDALCRTPASARRVFVAGRRGTALAGRKAAGKVDALDLTPNRIRADVTSTGAGFLFFSEAWYPAWTGFVDGVRVPIERVNVMFRGIAVPKGHHVIEMVYSSLPFRIGLWISLAGWAALGALLGYSIRRPPPSQKIAAPGA